MAVYAENNIYERFSKKEITSEKATSLLLEEIFRKTFYYQLYDLNEDEVNSFLVWIHKYIPGILQRYKKNKSNFLTFFTQAIRLQAKSWKRMYTKDKMKQIVLDSQHEEQQESYSDTSEMYISETTPVYGANRGKRQSQAPSLSHEQSQTLLVLALKNYPFLTSRHIEKLPGMIGIPPQKFDEYLSIMHDKTTRNRERFQQESRKLNKSFILCKQYQNELQNMDSSRTQYMIVQEQLERQKVLLSIRRERHMKALKQLVPKNVAIEQTLNYPAGTVRKILIKAENNVQDIKEILDPQEK